MHSIHTRCHSHSTIWLALATGAAYARISPATLRREAKAGRLRGYKVGGRRVWRFPSVDIDNWLNNTGVQR